MSKEYTPKYRLEKSKDSLDVRENKEGGKYTCEIPTAIHRKKASQEKAEFVLNILNNHDRLVEALEEAYAALGKCTIVDGSTIDAHLKAKQLLTELKIIK